MKKCFFSALLLSLLTGGYMVPVFGQPDTTGKPAAITPAKKIDSNMLVVINGKTAGTIRELKKDINSLAPAETIDRMNVLKGEQATSKYGEAGKYGVIELVLKKATGTPGQAKEEDTDNKIFDTVETEASFPGGDNNWRKYLERTLDPNVPIDNGAPAGKYKVLVQFIVDKSGNISDLKALTKFGYGMEAEVMRIISKGPQWTPAIQNGRAVKAYRLQPVTFVVFTDLLNVTVKGQTDYILKAGTSNEVKIAVENIKDEDLTVTITGGTVSRTSPGVYNIKVHTPGHAILTVTYKQKKREESESIYFEVQ